MNLPSTTFSLPIEGMTCAACAGRVERALKRVPGVTLASVNLAAATARVDGDSSVAPTTLVAAIADAGYGVPVRHVGLAIEGMTCAACVGRVERALAAVPGVSAARVNLATARADVAVPAGLVAPAALVAAVSAAGYGARPVDAGADADAANASAARRARVDVAETILGLAIAAPFALDMVNHLLGRASWLPAWLQLALALPVQTWLAWPFLRATWKSARVGAATMDTLVTLGTVAAFALSLASMAGLVPASGSHAGHGGLAPLYFEASVMVIALVRLGRLIETRAKAATVAAIDALRGLRPGTVRLRDAAGERDVALATLRVDDVFVARPGEDIAADGIVIGGGADVSEALATGESRPIAKAVGDIVIAGATALDGMLVVRATAVGEGTRLARIASAVLDAQTGKMPVERLVDRITSLFVPAVLALALLTLAGWWTIAGDPARALVAAATVLVVACPCALGLATPMAIAVGLGVAARRGLLVREPAALDRLARVDTVVFDKTGTLTEGRPVVTNILVAPGMSGDAIVRLAAAAQTGSEHPLGRAIRAAAGATVLPAATDFRAHVGRGVVASVEAMLVAVGNAALMIDRGIDTRALDADMEAARASGATVVCVAADATLLGALVLTDAPRPTARDAVRTLLDRGLSVRLLSGDAQPTAASVGAALGIADVAGGRTPEGKIAALREMKAAGRSVVMVGDGINDAPALATADVGIAMGGGSDLTLGAADIALLRDDPALVPLAFDLARAIRRNIAQNLGWAFAYNVVALPLAVAGILPPALAGAAMAFSSVAVVLNAWTLRRTG